MQTAQQTANLAAGFKNNIGPNASMGSANFAHQPLPQQMSQMLPPQQMPQIQHPQMQMLPTQQIPQIPIGQNIVNNQIVYEIKDIVWENKP